MPTGVVAGSRPKARAQPAARREGSTRPAGAGAMAARNARTARAAPLNRPGRDAEIRRRLAAGESVRAVARALRCGLATVQRSRLAVGMRGAPRPVSGSVP